MNVRRPGLRSTSEATRARRGGVTIISIYPSGGRWGQARRGARGLGCRRGRSATVKGRSTTPSLKIKVSAVRFCPGPPANHVFFYVVALAHRQERRGDLNQGDAAMPARRDEPRQVAGYAATEREDRAIPTRAEGRQAVFDALFGFACFGPLTCGERQPIDAQPGARQRALQARAVEPADLAIGDDDVAVGGGFGREIRRQAGEQTGPHMDSRRPPGGRRKLEIDPFQGRSHRPGLRGTRVRAARSLQVCQVTLDQLALGRRVEILVQ